MNKLKKCLLLAILATQLASCGSKMVTKTGTFYEPGHHDTIPYTLLKHEKLSKNLLVYLAPALDSFSFRGSEMEKALFKTGYDILIVSKPHTSDYYSLKTMDYKSTRINDVMRTYRFLEEKNMVDYKKLVVMGIGEGAYLAPIINTMMGGDTAIMINGGPFSQLIEIERAAQDGLTENEKEFFERHFKLSKQEDILTALERVRTTEIDRFVLGKNMNKYWITYAENNTSQDYEVMKGHAVWIFFEDYALHKKHNEQYLRSLSAMRVDNRAEQHLLKGDGNIDDPMVREILTRKLVEILAD